MKALMIVGLLVGFSLTAMASARPEKPSSPSELRAGGDGTGPRKK